MTQPKQLRVLTIREWGAIAEALAARLAGEFDYDGLGRGAYQRALDKVQERLSFIEQITGDEMAPCSCQLGLKDRIAHD